MENDQGVERGLLGTDHTERNCQTDQSRHTREDQLLWQVPYQST